LSKVDFSRDSVEIETILIVYFQTVAFLLINYQLHFINCIVFHTVLGWKCRHHSWIFRR